MVQGVHFALARYDGTPNSLTANGTTVRANTGHVFTAAVATFTDTRGLKPATAYTAMIDWGDGAAGKPDVSTGTVTWVTGHTFRVTGTHTYALAGAYQLTVTVQGPAGASVSARGMALVSRFAAATGVKGVARIGPLSPVVRPGIPSSRPLPSAIITVQPAGGGAEIARAVANSQGFFQINLPPGSFLLVPLPPTGWALARALPQTVKVGQNGFTAVTVNFDSGLR
jgi:hypothetical protein